MTYQKKFDISKLSQMPAGSGLEDYIETALDQDYDGKNPLHWLIFQVASAWGERMSLRHDDPRVVAALLRTKRRIK